MIYKTKTLSIDIRQRLFWSLVAISVLCVGVYIYAVNATVHLTLSRQNLEAEVATVGAKLGEKQFAYIAEKNKVTLATAYEHGFIDVTSPTYVSRTEAPALSINLNR